MTVCDGWEVEEEEVRVETEAWRFTRSLAPHMKGRTFVLRAVMSGRVLRCTVTYLCLNFRERNFYATKGFS